MSQEFRNAAVVALFDELVDAERRYLNLSSASKELLAKSTSGQFGLKFSDYTAHIKKVSKAEIARNKASSALVAYASDEAKDTQFE